MIWHKEDRRPLSISSLIDSSLSARLARSCWPAAAGCKKPSPRSVEAEKVPEVAVVSPAHASLHWTVRATRGHRDLRGDPDRPQDRRLCPEMERRHRRPCEERRGPGRTLGPGHGGGAQPEEGRGRAGAQVVRSCRGPRGLDGGPGRGSQGRPAPGRGEFQVLPVAIRSYHPVDRTSRH